MPESQPRSLLALDFDGVICDSLREVFAVAVAAYAEMAPGSPLVDQLGEDPLTAASGPLLDRFRDLVPLGNRGEDFGIALKAMDAAVDIRDQQGYDLYKNAFPQSFLSEYHQCFYRHRARLRVNDLGAWLALHAPYRPFITLLRACPPHIELAIATAKDHASVRLLLDHFGIGDLFPDAMILDKETASEKRVHLELFSRQLQLPPSRISFIDDKLNHLLGVAKLGVRPILASWGYNTRREREAAVARGIAVASLENAARVVFSTT